MNEAYFWTDTVKDWKRLLKQDKYKQVVIEELQWLVERKLIVVYGFVIMPNHLHLIWEMLAKNGKDMPHASFNKWTSGQFLADLRGRHPQVLPHYGKNTLFPKNPFFYLRGPKTKEPTPHRVGFCHN